MGALGAQGPKFNFNKMEIQVFNKDGQLVTTSLNVADVTGKAHTHVIRDIERLIEKGSARPNFGSGSFFIEDAYIDANNQHRKMYYLTRKGTAWLINRYTGDAAVDFQLAYIERFEEMESKIQLVMQATQVLTPREESVKILKLELDVFALLDVPLHFAQIESVKTVKAITGIDYSDKLKLAPAQNGILDHEVMLEPTELGKKYGINGSKMNKLLASLGLQTKINGKWTATDAAKGYYTRHSWISGAKSGYNYKWNESKIMNIINKLISNYDCIQDCIKELCK